MCKTEHYKSAHIANKQALNTIYIRLKTFRDQYFKSDWNKKLLRKNRKLRTVNTHPISINGSINSSACGCTKEFLCSEFGQSRFSLKGISGLGKDFEGSYLVKKLWITFEFSIRIPPQLQYMIRVWTTKGNLYLYVGGFLFFYWYASQEIKIICLSVYGTLGMLQDNIHSKDL